MDNFAGRVYVMRQSFAIRIVPSPPEPEIPASVRASMPTEPYPVRLAFRAFDTFDRVFGVATVPTDQQWFARAVGALIAVGGVVVAAIWGVRLI